MEEKQARATKKQQELLEFVAKFIAEHDYGPSYREIMAALSYKSVSTVAVHVEGLIAKGFLRRGDNEARSLEIVATGAEKPPSDSDILSRIESLLKISDSIEDRRSLLRSLELLGESERVAKFKEL